MASPSELKKYLAYWFQLGKRVLIDKGKKEFLPQNIFFDGDYSQEFEDCWQEIIASAHNDAYLEGTEETIADLLSPEWELIACARCCMPVPVRYSGLPTAICPCHDLQNWPNDELPSPNCPVDNQIHLARIRYRLENHLDDKVESLEGKS